MNNLSDYSIFYGLLSFTTLIISSLIVVRLCRPYGLVDAALFFFTAFTGQIILTGYILSSMNALSQLGYWVVAGFLLLGVVLFISSQKRFRRQPEGYKLRIPSRQNLITWFQDLSGFEKIILIPMILVTILTSSISLLMIFFSTPFNWDGMTYHLARAAYYMQHNNLGFYEANYWAQVVHPKNATILIIYTFLVTGLDENLTRLIQFGAYWIATVAVYGISRNSGFSRSVSLFSALVFALLIETLLQAITVQNDLLLTAYIGAAICFLFAFKRSNRRSYLVWSSINLALAIGIKASAFLALPSFFIIAWYALRQQPVQETGKNFAFLLLSIGFALILFALPAGYWANYQTFDHPIGPESIRTHHSFEGRTIGEIASLGSKNLLRFGFDFLSLDGLPQVGPILTVQTYLRAVPVWLVNTLNINLETTQGVIEPFQYQRVPRAHEDGAFWGVLGFGLIWIIVFLAAIGLTKEPAYQVLSIAALIFWIVQAVAGPYDPWRGRYFITAALFAVPPVGWLFEPDRSKIIKVYLLGIILVGALSAFSAVALRPRSMLFTIQYKSEIRQSVFGMDRLTQLTRNRPDSYEILNLYESVVPQDATVAVYLEANSYEYPLFGENLSRTLIPVNSFWQGPQAIPEQADYLIFSSNLLEPSETDLCPASGSYCLRDLRSSR